MAWCARRHRRSHGRPGGQQGLTRLRERLARDRDFAARATTVRTGEDLAVLSLPLAVHPSSKRASAAVDRLREEYVPAAFGPRAGRVEVGGTPAENVDYFDLIGRDGIVYGVGSTARLITGAALIIVVVFAAFATGDLVSFQQMGFGVARGAAYRRDARPRGADPGRHGAPR